MGREITVLKRYLYLNLRPECRVVNIIKQLITNLCHCCEPGKLLAQVFDDVAVIQRQRTSVRLHWCMYSQACALVHVFTILRISDMIVQLSPFRQHFVEVNMDLHLEVKSNFR